jgi:hypothetical protein
VSRWSVILVSSATGLEYVSGTYRWRWLAKLMASKKAPDLLTWHVYVREEAT